MNTRRVLQHVSLVSVLLSGFICAAQTADQAWLRYHSAGEAPAVPRNIVLLGSGEVEKSAGAELLRGLRKMGVQAEIGSQGASPSIVLGTYQEFRKRYPSWIAYGEKPVTTLHIHDDLRENVPLAEQRPFQLLKYSPHIQGFSIHRESKLDPGSIFIEAPRQDGVLYGAFALLRILASGESLPESGWRETPAMPIRWLDEWDNIDGSIERGYAGRSIFFEGGHVREDLALVAEYARLLASIGINGCNLNNVNNASVFFTPEMLKEVARIADTMRPYGVHVSLSADIASPKTLGGLSSFDPLDPAVKKWWSDKINEIYALIPDFGGFTVKADSEGQPGPASYGRSPADAANTLAAALAPHGGVVLYRAFVYNHHLDWNDPKADRARAAYDIFHPLDGKFAPNVIIQTKEGPIDFQAREPVSPLFGGLSHTNQAMELQITQEYLGQQRHLVYIAPMWKEVLDFDMRVNGGTTPVKQIITGQTFHRQLGGMIGVACVGRGGWLGSPLALANLYAFGRLAWNPDLRPEEIAAEWIKQTISPDIHVLSTVEKMLMRSWLAYESYTGPLGLQTLTDITGSHYGPNVEASERNGWGQWHKADHDGVGFDRTVASGTGYVGQYSPEVAKMYESTATTPDNLLLFFHHVPYTYKLNQPGFGGKTVIQYIYDSHYDGAAQAAQFVSDWAGLEGRIDQKLFEDVRERLRYQAGHAIVWRDAVTQYFLKLSGIPDAQGRAGNYPNRLEAEDAKLTGYKVINVNPWEDASRGKAVSCDDPQPCTAEFTYNGKAGRFDIAVEYFDLQAGAAHFELSVNGLSKAQWEANATLPSRHPHGDNSIRHIARDVELKPGDRISIKGRPDGQDAAALDYIEFSSVGQIQ